LLFIASSIAVLSVWDRSLRREMKEHSKRRLVGLTSAAIWALGCGGGSSVPTRTSQARDGGIADAEDMAHRSDAGTDAADATCGVGVFDAGQAAVASQNGGKVIFTQAWDDFGNCSAEFLAYFYRAGELAYPPLGLQDFYLAFDELEGVGPGVCIVLGAGACTVYTTECAIPTVPSCPGPEGGKLTLGDPGRLGIDGDALTPRTNGAYSIEYPFSVANPGGPGANLLEDGDLVTLSATAGSDVPAFGMDVVAPGCVAVTAPQRPDGGASYSISTAQDLRLSWTGGEPGASLGLDLVGQILNRPGFVDVSCIFQATDGQGTVPQAALAALAGWPWGALSVYQQRSATVQSGTFAVEFDVRNLGGGGAPDGGSCPANNANVTFQ
jgi:hypothetical protein